MQNTILKSRGLLMKKKKIAWGITGAGDKIVETMKAYGKNK